MATATPIYTINPSLPLGEALQKTVRFYGTVTFSAVGDTYATGGLAAKTGSAFKNMGAPYSDRAPIFVKIWSAAGSGLDYEYVVSSGLLKIFGGGSASGGTIASVINLAAGNSGTVSPVTLSANANNAALTNNNNATPLTGITGVVSTFTGNAVSGAGEIANTTALNGTTPAVSTDVVKFELVVVRN